MNPMLQQFNQHQQQSQAMNSRQGNILSNLKSYLAQINDPRSYMLNLVNKMDPQQKEQLRNMLPKMSAIAKSQGLNITDEINELQSRM